MVTVNSLNINEVDNWIGLINELFYIFQNIPHRFLLSRFDLFNFQYVTLANLFRLVITISLDLEEVKLQLLILTNKMLSRYQLNFFGDFHERASKGCGKLTLSQKQIKKTINLKLETTINKFKILAERNLVKQALSSDPFSCYSIQ